MKALDEIKTAASGAVVSNPGILGGTPVFQGTRLPVQTLFDYLVESLSIELDPPTDFQIGGDPRGKRAKLEITLSPTPIRLVDFYAPPSVV